MRALDDAVVLTGDQDDAAHAVARAAERLETGATPVLRAGSQNQPTVERLGLAHADIHGRVGALRKADQRVAPELHAAAVLVAQGVDGGHGGVVCAGPVVVPRATVAVRHRTTRAHQPAVAARQRRPAPAIGLRVTTAAM